MNDEIKEQFIKIKGNFLKLANLCDEILELDKVESSSEPKVNNKIKDELEKVAALFVCKVNETLNIIEKWKE